ncbi:MAG: ADP-ribosylation factor-directed GTPase activating protein isoform b [Planctomycetota bacterium]
MIALHRFATRWRHPIALCCGLWLPLISGCPTWHAPQRTPIGESSAESEIEGDVSPTSNALVARIDRVLSENLEHRRLSLAQQGGWQILHGVLAYGRDLTLTTAGGPVVVVDYVLDGGSLQGFELRRGDVIEGRRGVRAPMQISTKIGQGHRDQWLAIIAQTGLPASHAVVVPGDDSVLTIDDWVRQAEHDVPLNLELEFSWTLIALLAYRNTDHRWTSRDGLDYSVETLLASELRRDLELSVCGGTHRLNAIAMALEKRRAEGRPMTGVWKDAEAAVDAAHRLAKRNQNPDGSYSLAYLHRNGWARDLGEQLGTTGHVLEFLALSSPAKELQQPWVQRCVGRICDLLDQCASMDLECGVLYHALHGLREYRDKL